MSSTTILTEDSATIVADKGDDFRWGVVIAGALAAIATIFFLLTLGAGIGLALVSRSTSATSFLTLGAVYFFASQAFGFAVGGYLVGRLTGPEIENTAEEEFRAGAHGLVMWALAIVASLLIVGASSAVGGATIAASAARNGDMASTSSGYWTDALFRPALNSAQVTADKNEASRILAMDAVSGTDDADTTHLARMISQDSGLSMQAAMNRVADVEVRARQAADKARKATSILALWTAFALLFGAIVAVAAAISARWADDRINFGLAPRR